MNVSDAARHFSKVIRHAERHGSTLLLKKGKPVARVVPAEPKAKTGRELAKLWPKLHHLTKEEAESFAADLENGRRSLPPLVSPWDK